MKNAQIWCALACAYQARRTAASGPVSGALLLTPVALFHSEGLLQPILDMAWQSLRDHSLPWTLLHEVTEASVEQAVRLLGAVQSSSKALIGLGGGKALDVAKYTLPLLDCLTLRRLPFSTTVSAECELTLEGQRRSLPIGPPEAVVIDLAVCRRAAHALAFWSWRFVLYVHGRCGLGAGLLPAGDSVNDLAAWWCECLSIHGKPGVGPTGNAACGTALSLNGVVMEIAGCGRPEAVST